MPPPSTPSDAEGKNTDPGPSAASRLFDTYVMVDWSGASVPVTGANSIWLGVTRSGDRKGAATAVENIPTRAGAIARIADLLVAERAAGRRALVGFDFPFGYPAGVARTLTGAASALALWDWLSDRIEDAADNANNRFEVAAEINRHYPGVGPFWGRPESWDHPDIPTRARDRQGEAHPSERRQADRAAKGAKTVWQLAYAGSVGSQVLLGLPALNRLRRDQRIAAETVVWPFQTGLAPPRAPIVLAEIYPSLVPPHPDEPIKDAGQVRAVAEWLARLDSTGTLAGLFDAPRELGPDARQAIETEEAWILGAGHGSLLRGDPSRSAARGPARGTAPLRYERDPAEIYRQSFATVEAEARLDHLPEALRDVAIRLVHACGMTDVPNRLAWSENVAAAAGAALAAGAPILCDCEMVASGIIRRALPAQNEVVCTLNAPEVPALAAEIGNTRSAAAVELWLPRLAGAVVVIGNAPTALFHLLELLDAGAPKPAAILGFPVGFVGAAESKAELAANPRGVPYLTLRGRRGGSAMAAAALNALATEAAR